MYTPTATLSEKNNPLPRPSEPDAKELYVNVTWNGPTPLDRPCVGGWVFSPSQRKLAERLVRAINAGVVYTSPTLRTDVNGRTYVEAKQTQFFHKRHMHKSLLAVGF